VSAPALIAVDWGSTNFRALLLDAQGHCLETANSDLGILSASAIYRDKGFMPVLTQQLQRWAERYSALPVVLAGMVGSRSGWYETPYIETPASIDAIASKLFKIPEDVFAGAWIVPGVKGITPNHMPDVMRGEEAQLAGALLRDVQAGKPTLAILPGTHSKWVSVNNGRIESFATAISGEIFAMLRQHSCLAPLLDGGVDACDADEFNRGVELSKLAGEISHHVFMLRSKRLLGQIDASQALQQLSGLVIGSEIANMQRLFSLNGRVAVIGGSNLSELYRQALNRFDVNPALISGDTAFACGVVAIARAAKMIA
jgi:2-dehydro-3-deoxygalactonokinase